MRFVVEQPIAAPREAVEAAFADPSFYAQLGTLDDIATPEVLTTRRDAAGLVHLRVRYAFVGDLGGAARAVLHPARRTWVDESWFDPAVHRVNFHMVPEHYGGRLECSGSYTFEVLAADRTSQVMRGEVRVHYPLVGGLAERAIVTGLRHHLGQEAAVIERWAAAHA